MRSRAFRTVAATLTMICLFALVVAPAQAGPVQFIEVVHVVGNFQDGGQQELRLRTVSQQTGTTQTTAASGATTKSASTNTSDNKLVASAETGATTTPPSALAGSAIATQQQGGGNIEVIEQGDIGGTICDCGEIEVPGHGWPKWPLLALGLIPIPFLPHDHDTPPDTPFTPPNTPEVPEPASLLLLGTGLVALGVGGRRRYARVKLAKQEAANAREV